ncbi:MULTISPECIES: 3-hydroxybutyryl-CoA dehydrogenase [Streptomyces]|uniref:3-hydroxybutyryl-CoA dehydrogenase n=2 Tax=Streptomyces rimosus subsp. rimosus TaxID=132474 RepID=L8EVD9_STRR1|nr:MULTISPECIES: 3-hydroxybutyryl-CoA dehydrogenase [Streptomyces]KOG75069.1 3-hydroxybutyryl-CoA dehydrogenase [Kitasatospora aureofaciens]MYT45450.1 3-hydroxybutyryl-CoA dehydrogenase [Streptomyces sp. SID5471]KOT41861.1 3-hydroxybutyryl-CoA dehydrogenase [Streptomyces sp. NRRL WC-3701]KOT44015.1 3-hydroxybutyryl-CoA dehydrogenase [Streptomyces rimosus subsp. rimosus]KOT67355.1 3-hydroxybutyryl-CoA dehydrogenase [Streptomyces rimosus subsp. rimosus]
MSPDIRRVGVVGGGQMGAGIAEVCARAGLDTVVCEVDAVAARAARDRVAASLDRAVRRGRLTEAAAGDALARLVFTGSLEALADRSCVIEAVVENPDAKTEVFAALDKIVEDPAAVLATNTSSLPVMRVGMATGRADRVVGLHFFNPVPVMPLVEVVTSLHTSAATAAAAEDFATRVLGRTVIRSKDRAGFVVNALLVPYLLAAIRMAESGFATAADIDTGMELGCAHPMGPLKLADLIGLDTVASIAESLYDEFREPLYAPPPLLHRMVEAGLLGRKTGRGFHPYGQG